MTRRWETSHRLARGHYTARACGQAREIANESPLALPSQLQALVTSAIRLRRTSPQRGLPFEPPQQLHVGQIICVDVVGGVSRRGP